MLSPLGTRLIRALIALLLCAQFIAAFPGPQTVSAAPLRAIIIHFDVIAVVRDESVTIRTRDLPVRTKFIARIDKTGKWAVGGPVVGEFNSDKGGEIEMTLPIPEELHGQRILAIRLESPDHYNGDSWFFNRTQVRPLFRTVKPSEKLSAPAEIDFADVKANQSFTLKGKNFTPQATFAVRVGPFENFYTKYVRLDPVTSDANGTLNASLTIPASLKDVENVQVVLDGDGKAVKGIFKNTDGGQAVAEQSLYKLIPCTVVNVAPVPSLARGEEFDAVWTVQNTAPWDWKADTVNYRFNGGERLQKYDKHVYGIGWEVKRGWTFDVAIDMRAPDEPGWHRTQWAVLEEHTDYIYCTLDISFFVHD